MRQQLNEILSASNRMAESLEGLAGFCTTSIAYIEQAREAQKRVIDDHADHFVTELTRMRERLREEVKALRGSAPTESSITDVRIENKLGVVVEFTGQQQ